MTWLDEETIKQLQSKTIDKCSICKPSTRGIVVEDGKIVNCECITEFRNLRILAEANVPLKHWTFDFRNLSQDFQKKNDKELGVLRKYVENIDRNIQECNSLYLQGESGLAKSAIASYILRKAVQVGFAGYMVRLSKVTAAMFNQYTDEKASALVKFLQTSVQIVVVDEVDKEYGVVSASSAAGVKVAEIFGDWYDRKVTMICTANKPKNQLVGILSSSVIDRINESTDIILIGESFRKSSHSDVRILNQVNNEG
jgi:DNA replication protein DnaC